jgi:DNA-binding NarL/FixJ family response regulator
MLDAFFEDPASPHAAPYRGSRRIALGVERPADRDVFLSVLAVGGLPVNCGALPLQHAHELAVNAPDAFVLVADLRHPEPLAALRSLRKAMPDTRIAAVGDDDDAAGRQVRQALNAGADAFVARSAAERSLVAAIQATLAGLVCTPREARRVLVKPTFSHREKEVLGLLVAGLTNREIAGRLFLAESTVKSHLMSAFAKLGVRSRKDAASLLLDPDEGLAAISLPPGSPRAPGLG